MTSLWAPSYHSDTDSDLDSDKDIDMDNETIPPGVAPEFVHCVHALKWKLYQAIVLGPEPNTPEAQQNELLQVYVTRLDQLYHILEKALRGSVTDAEVRPFPVRLRREILGCAMGLKKTPKTPHVADTVPYRDFLTETLRMFPFVHRMVGGSNDVESL